jgi:hypothetical protein
VRLATFHTPFSSGVASRLPIRCRVRDGGSSAQGDPGVEPGHPNLEIAPVLFEDRQISERRQLAVQFPSRDVVATRHEVEDIVGKEIEPLLELAHSTRCVVSITGRPATVWVRVSCSPAPIAPDRGAHSQVLMSKGGDPAFD